MNVKRKGILSSIDEANRRFDGAFFTALGIVLMLRTLAYVDTIAAVRVGLGAELNPLAQLDTSFVAQWDVLLAMSVVFLAILIKRKETRIVCYSFVVALVSADFSFDIVQFLQLPPVNLAIAQVYAVVWGVTAIIPFAVAVWQIEEMVARKAREAKPLEWAKLRDLELTT